MLVEQTMLVPANQSALLLLGMGADPSPSGFLYCSPPVQMHSLAVLAFSLFKVACKNFGVFKSIFFKGKCCLYVQKASQESA